ncbi:MAG: VCBS repeat-containing protein [Bacteroidales bacterium]|nr:VCBS repeat-containing protein [Bacteroidales bacterium]
MYKFILNIILLISFQLLPGNRSEYITGVKAYSVFPSDLDLDGDIDLVIEHRVMSGATNPSITIMENTNYGNFIIKNTKSFTHLPLGIIAFDVDNNSFPDIITTYSHYLRVYLNEGTLDFSNWIDYDLINQSQLIGMHYGDINGDGFLDIVLISNCNWVGLVYNNGQGGFHEPDYYSINTNIYPKEIVCGDLNNDGRDDLIIAGLSLTILWSFEYSFEEQQFPYMFNEVDVCDYDNDGDLDIVCARDFGFHRFGIYENVGHREFEAHIEYFDHHVAGYICSDLNNDSLPDIIITGIGIRRIYRNSGNFSFNDPIILNTPIHGEDFLFSKSADFDNNNYNDIVTNRYKDTEIPNIRFVFNDGKFNFFEEPLIKFQNYSLSQGYNFVSSRIIPNEAEMTSVLESILDGELGFVRNSSGEVLHKIGDQWINGIGDWQTTEGYLFYLNDTANYDIVGTYIDPQTPIALKEGYQFISFLPDQPLNAMQVFYYNLENLDFVRNDEGKMLRLIGNQWINNIGDLQPDEGYLVKMNGNDTLVYPE